MAPRPVIFHAITAQFLVGVAQYDFDAVTGTYSNGAHALRVKPHPTSGQWVFTLAAGATMSQATRDELAVAGVIRADGSYFASTGEIRQLCLDGDTAVTRRPPAVYGSRKRKRREKRTRHE